MQVAGRVLFKGVPTGLAVTAAQHHGGPYPSSTKPATTSAGIRGTEPMSAAGRACKSAHLDERA